MQLLMNKLFSVSLNKKMRLFQLIKGWFGTCRGVHNIFLQAMLCDDLDTMNEAMNEISSEVFSSFDTGRKPSEKTQPERFYHGFVLGLIAELQGRYVITSNRESGLGRYDIMLDPTRAEDPAFIMEFKVVHTKRESLEDRVNSALQQIEERRYETVLLSRGISPKQIRKYGFAFEGSKVLIGKEPFGIWNCGYSSPQCRFCRKGRFCTDRENSGKQPQDYSSRRMRAGFRPNVFHQGKSNQMSGKTHCSGRKTE